MEKFTNSELNWHIQCEQLSMKFAIAIDHCDYDGLLSLFTENASLSRFGTTSTGKKELRIWLNERPVQTIRHVCTNFSAHKTSENSASGITYFTAYRALENGEGPFETSGPFMVGEYEDKFELTKSGWKISNRNVKVIFQAPA